MPRRNREMLRLTRRQQWQAGPPSPCISVCKIDPHSGYCTGCWRSLEEIRDWIILGFSERSEILAQVAQRRSAHDNKS